MDKIQNDIINLNCLIKDLMSEKKEKVNQLNAEKNNLKELKVYESSMIDVKKNIQDIVKLIDNKYIFIIKDEILAIVTLVIDLFIATLSLASPLVNLSLIALVTFILFYCQLLSNNVNKKLINYYKDINMISSEKNVNITNKKAKILLRKMNIIGESLEQNIYSNSLEICSISERIEEIESNLALINSKIKLISADVRVLVNERNKIIAEDEVIESRINKGYLKALKK